jgi:hypothetical protein
MSGDCFAYKASKEVNKTLSPIEYRQYLFKCFDNLIEYCEEDHSDSLITKKNAALNFLARGFMNIPDLVEINKFKNFLKNGEEISPWFSKCLSE